MDEVQEILLEPGGRESRDSGAVRRARNYDEIRRPLGAALLRTYRPLPHADDARSKATPRAPEAASAATALMTPASQR